MLDFSELDQYRENNRLEAKKASGGLPRGLWETYSAFANTQGGCILLGAEAIPDGTLNPVELPDPEKLVVDFWSAVNDRQKVRVNILEGRRVQIVEAGGRRIVRIDVPRANRRDKPVYIGDNPFTGTYRRDGSGDHRCAEEQVRAMMSDQAETPQDARVLERLAWTPSTGRRCAATASF
jgi:predicted HTH transcriptional regulator